MTSSASGTTGYCDCPCRDCFEVAMTDDCGVPSLCSDCEDAGCSVHGSEDCQVDGRYGEDDGGQAARYANDGTVTP